MQEQEFRFNLESLLSLIIKWKKQLIVVALVTIVLSALVSFLITPLFKSTVVMFPASTNSVSKILLSQNFGGKDDILGFGESEQTEQMLQILNSSDLRNLVVKRFNLLEHYQIDPSSENKLTRLNDKYKDNIRFKRTEYMGVLIEVYDRNADTAANMANTIAALYDTLKNSMQRERATQAFKLVEEEYLRLRGDIKEMEDSLTVLRSLGINDYESQAEVLNERLAFEIARNNTSAINAINNKLALLGKYGSAYVSLRDALEYEKKRLSEIKGKFDEAKVDATQDIPQKFIVERAYKAEKKAYPIRSLIVFGSLLSALFLSILVIIMKEKGIKKNL